MTIPKWLVRAGATLKDAIIYASKSKEDGSIVSYGGVSHDPELASMDMRAVQQQYNFTHDVGHSSLIQSFSQKESALLGVQGVNELGVQLVEKYFPGHQYVVGTHNDTENLHNHIVINRVSMDGKSVIQNKDHLNPLIRLGDKQLKERGLEPLSPRGPNEEKMKDQRERKREFKVRNYPYIKDMKQKIDFARKISTDFKEFGAFLKEMGIGVRVEKKNISYFYGNRKKAVRGDTLGEKYERQNLIKSFDANERKERGGFKLGGYFRRKKLLKEYEKGATGRNPSDLSQQQYVVNESKRKFNEDYVDLPRRKQRVMDPSSDELSRINFPLRELQKAQSGSIKDYLRRNKIKTEKNQKGDTVLKEREHVVIHDSHWENTKNKTQGGLVELVSIHKNLSFLEAVSLINKNNQIRELGKRIGDSKHMYRSFHVPKEKRANLKQTKRILNSFIESRGLSRSKVSEAVKEGKLVVKNNGSVMLYPKNDYRGGFEYSKSERGKWIKRKVGEFKNPFESRSNHRNLEANILISPMEALRTSKAVNFARRDRDKSFLVLMEENEEVFENFMVQNKNLKKVLFLMPTERDSLKGLSIFISKLNKKYQPRGIEISLVSHKEEGRSRTILREGRGLDL